MPPVIVNVSLLHSSVFRQEFLATDYADLSDFNPLNPLNPFNPWLKNSFRAFLAYREAQVNSAL